MGPGHRIAQRISVIASAIALAGCALISGAADLTVGDVDGDGAAPTNGGGDLDAATPDGAVIPGVDGGGGRFDGGGADAKASPDAGDASSRLRNATFEDGTLTGIHGGDSMFGTPFLATGASALSGTDSLAVDKGTSGIQVDVPTLDQVYATTLVRGSGFGFSNDDTILAFVPESGGTIAELHVQTSVIGASLVLEVGGIPVGSTSAVTTNTTYRVGAHLRQDSTAKLIEVFVAPAGMAFAAPFASSSIPLGRTIGVRIGALGANSTSAKIVFDDLLIDTAAMPGP